MLIGNILSYTPIGLANTLDLAGKIVAGAKYVRLVGNRVHGCQDNAAFSPESEAWEILPGIVCPAVKKEEGCAPSYVIPLHTHSRFPITVMAIFLF
ncbi:hypothetical protein [Brevibacillus gelatini]|uniref:hypothetical protein n=1 Tax=Brevibacillus gelatini TaxID=1655277 RepID=UPI0011CE0528|nr:hypothetical protein [Brevibacillus gelatini]